MELGNTFSLGFSCMMNGTNYDMQFDSGCSCEHVRNCTMVCNLTEGVQVISEITCEKEYNLLRRRDSIKNRSEQTVVITKPASTISLPVDGPMYGFESTWCHEFTPTTGTEFSAKNRTCNDYQPYSSVKTSDSTVVLNILPTGDWRVRLISADGSDSKIAIDLNDDKFAITLKPGEDYYFVPEYLISCFDGFQPYPASTNIQKYAVNQMRNDQLNRPLPVVYNTWFDHFHKISIDGMLRQAEAAKEIGCEVFVIDAGWFGPGVRHWTYVGDWRENPSVYGEMSQRQFSDKIREMGLGFGIWMEPERMHQDCPARLEHPDWFINTPGSEYYYPDLTKQECEEYIFSEISRVISEYDVKWIKIDCNGQFSDDIYHCGHRKRMERWYVIMDKLINAFPGTVFEACASGGLRADLNTLSHYHTHFQSDTVDPVDNINMGMSALTRLTPGMESKWAVFYPAEGFTPYDSEPLDTGDYILSSTLATSYKLSTYDLSFAIRAAMPSALGLGGNIAGLRPKQREKLKNHISFYKNNRDFIQNAYGIPLSGVTASIDSKMRIMQLENADCSRFMIFAFNLGLDAESATVCLVHLDKDVFYDITNVDTNESYRLAGAEIMNDGIATLAIDGQRSVVYDIRRVM